MTTDSEGGWESDEETRTESELQETRKYDTALQKERKKALKRSESIVDAPPTPEEPMGETSNACKSFEDKLRDEPGLKLGFVIFRTTYKSQEKWNHFMDHLNARTQLSFERENAAHLFNHVDWCVQEDPSLARASSTRIRREFKKWIRECGEKDHWLGGSARYRACVMIDEASLNRVLKGLPPSDIDAKGFGAVRLVSLDKEEDEMFAGLSFLVPRIFSLLEDCGWDNFVPGEGEYVACP